MKDHICMCEEPWGMGNAKHPRIKSIEDEGYSTYLRLCKLENHIYPRLNGIEGRISQLERKFSIMDIIKACIRQWLKVPRSRI